MKIPNILTNTDFLDSPSGGADIKKAFHTAGKTFLRSLAKELGNAATARIGSCLGGPGVLGEVSLHSEKLYVMLFESDPQNGVRVLYRTCRGQKDATGGTNRYASMKEMSNSDACLQSFIANCKRIEAGVITS